VTGRPLMVESADPGQELYRDTAWKMAAFGVSHHL